VETAAGTSAGVEWKQAPVVKLGLELRHNPIATGVVAGVSCSFR
jgi:hypothetical protein